MGVSTQLILKIRRQIQSVKGDMQQILVAHENKSKLNRAIVDRIKNRGTRYTHEFERDKRQLVEIIGEQEHQLHGVLETLEHIDRLLELIINTEQVSLLIDQRKRYGGISGLVDPISEPLDNFKDEIDEVKVIRDSFEVLKIELEKQREYVKRFDLEADDVDEEYFRKSEEYEAALSDQEVVSLTHLSAFCDALESQLSGRLKKDHKLGSDQVTRGMAEELSKTRLGGRFSPTIKSFLDHYVRRVINERAFARTFVLSLVFLLSRLAYFEKARFRRSLRLARLAYATAPVVGFEADQRDAIVLAALSSELGFFAEPAPNGDSIDDSERGVLARYYHLIKSTFIGRIPFLETIRQEAARPGETETTTWPERAGRFIAALDRSMRTIDEKGPSEQRVAHAIARVLKNETLPARSRVKLAKAVVTAYASLAPSPKDRRSASARGAVERTAARSKARREVSEKDE